MTLENTILQEYSAYLDATDPNFTYFGETKNLVNLACSLNQYRNNSVLLTGPAGIGRRSLIAGLVKNKGADGMPLETINTDFYRLNVEDLFDTNTVSKIEEKFSAVLDQLKTIKQRSGKKPVLVIDDGTNFVREVTTKKASSLLNQLIDADQTSDDFDLIFSADNDALHLLKTNYPNFVSKLSTQEVKQAETPVVLEMLAHEAQRYAPKGLTVSDKALEMVVKLAKRYPALGAHAMPKRASLFLDEVATAFRLEKHSKPEQVHEDESLRSAKQKELKKAQDAGESTADLEADIAALDASIATAMADWNMKKKVLLDQQAKISEYRGQIQIYKDKIESLIAKDQEAEQSTDDSQQNDSRLKRNPEISKLRTDIENIEASIEECNEKSAKLIGQMTYPVTLDDEYVDAYAKNKLGMNDVPDLRKSIRTADQHINGIVMGQEQMINPMISAIKQRLGNKKEAKKPKGVFLILGPSGVGKTFIAEVLAEELCGGKLNVINMEGFKEKHTVSRMIGAPPGYAGYDQKAELVKISEENPSGVILLDEIEKAHLDVKQALLTPLDKGSFTSANGRDTADFRDNIIIMTSNFGQQSIILPNAEESFEVWETKLKEEIFKAADHFSPEFLNRCTIVCADFLSDEVIEKVVTRRVNAFASEFVEDASTFKVEIDEESVKRFVADHYKKKNGARVVQDILQQQVGDHICNLVLDNDADDKNTCGVLKVCYNDGKFTYNLDENALTLKAGNENQPNAKSAFQPSAAAIA